jgi:hypothetical protein
MVQETQETQEIDLGIISYKDLRDKIRNGKILWCGKVKSNFTVENMPEKCIFPKDIAHKFIIALTSGCYSQAEMTLATIQNGKTYYCVMGLLLKILGASSSDLSMLIFSKQEVTNTTDKHRKMISTISGLNKEKVWWQFSSSIRYMNDYGGRSFVEIAEWIKQNIKTI